MDWNSVPNRKPYSKRGLQCRPLFSLSKKYYFNFYASCGSTRKIEFAKQIHNKSGRVPDFLYKGRKNVPVRARFFFSIRSKAWFRARGCSKSEVFRQPQKEVCPADLFSYLLRQHKMCQHGDTEDNPIPAEHLEIVLLDEAHQETDDEQ